MAQPLTDAGERIVDSTPNDGVVRRLGDRSLALRRGDITRVRADAIVNAANQHLAGGGGVDGAIHRAGGPSIMAECRRIGGCPTGGAVATSAGSLPARHVIHAVAPRWQGGERDEARMLESAYRESMRVADELGVGTIAFPSLGTGIYAYPIDQAARIATRTVAECLQRSSSVYRATFVLFSDHDFAVYEQALRELPDLPGS